MSSSSPCHFAFTILFYSRFPSLPSQVQGRMLFNNKTGSNWRRRRGAGADKNSWPRPLVNWQELSENHYPNMSWDLSSISRLQTLTLHKNDVNGVALNSNFLLATASRLAPLFYVHPILPTVNWN